MKRKKEQPNIDLSAMIRLALAAGSMPFTELDLTNDSLNLDELETLSPPAVASSKSEISSDMLPAGCGTHPITIRLPKWLIRSFKVKAEGLGVGYQTLMRRELQAAAYIFV